MKRSLILLSMLVFAGAITFTSSTAVAGESCEECEEYYSMKPPTSFLERRRLGRASQRHLGKSADQVRRGADTDGGDLLTNARWDVDYASSDVDNRDLGGDGDAHTLVVSLSGELTKNFNFVLDAGFTDYEIDDTAIDINSQFLEAVLLYNISDTMAVGPILGFSRMDISQPGTAGDDEPERWMAGLLATMNHNIDTVNVGLTTALTSMNKSSLEATLDNEDTIWSTMVDANTDLTDNVSAGVYATYMNFIDDEDPGDSSFWFLGLDVSYAFTDTAEISVGYETTASYNDFEENRISVGLSWKW